jgi:anti-sigma factor RsiW
MNRREAEINLAALLDGELRDPAQVAELNGWLARDPALRAEFESQRALKAALGSLVAGPAEQELRTPDFMATRVLGEIAARRKAPRPSLWRPLIAWGGSAAALVLGFFTTVQVMQPALQSATLTAQGVPAAVDASAAPVLPAGLTMQVNYAPQYWENLEMPDGVNDSQVKAFLTFANEAHNYRRLMHSGSELTTPDMAQAVLAMQEGGTGVVWASDTSGK